LPVCPCSPFPQEYSTLLGGARLLCLFFPWRSVFFFSGSHPMSSAVSAVSKQVLRYSRLPSLSFSSELPLSLILAASEALGTAPSHPSCWPPSRCLLLRCARPADCEGWFPPPHQTPRNPLIRWCPLHGGRFLGVQNDGFICFFCSDHVWCSGCPHSVSLVFQPLNTKFFFLVGCSAIANIDGGLSKFCFKYQFCPTLWVFLSTFFELDLPPLSFTRDFLTRRPKTCAYGRRWFFLTVDGPLSQGQPVSMSLSSHFPPSSWGGPPQTT